MSKKIVYQIDNVDHLAPPTVFLDIDGTLVRFPHTPKDTAFAINVDRDEGLKNVNV